MGSPTTTGYVVSYFSFQNEAVWDAVVFRYLMNTLAAKQPKVMITMTNLRLALTSGETIFKIVN